MHLYVFELSIRTLSNTIVSEILTPWAFCSYSTHQHESELFFTYVESSSHPTNRAVNSLASSDHDLIYDTV